MEKSLQLSVLMTAYNRENYICDAIESVLKSTFNNFELIIVDDCSSDQTLFRARRYELMDNRIKVYSNDTNLGDYLNRNKAASYATGDYLMYVDSDDTIENDGIVNCVSAMASYPEAAFGIYNKTYTREISIMGSLVAIKNHFFKEPFLLIGPGGTIIKRKFFEEIGGYPVKYGPANDMYFNLKAVSQSSIVLLPFEFVNYRRHIGQEINNWRSYLFNNYLYLDDALKELPLNLSSKQRMWISNKNKRRFLVNLVKYFFKSGDMSTIKSSISKAGFQWQDVLKAIFHN
ncbi:MAG: glycosyltransferase family A protein [Ferruginibacter sp.]|nr:glycosyltransferase family A protein [Ferruginibacter sp.]